MALHPAFAKPVAHRGLHNASVGVIENSATAFELAIARGYAVECDLQLTKDDIPVVVHDETLARVASHSGRIAEMTAREVTRIPLTNSKAGDTPLTFAQLLKLIDARTPLAVELKPQSGPRNVLLAQKAAEAVRDYSGLLAFISFDPRLLTALNEAGYTGPLGIIVERFESELARRHITALKRFSMRHLLHYPQTRFNFIASDQHALTLPATRLFRQLGFPVLTWTITSPEEAKIARQHADQIAFENFEPEDA